MFHLGDGHGNFTQQALPNSDSAGLYADSDAADVQNAQQAPDMPGTFIVMGIVAVMLFQIVVNVGMVVGLMPVTGIPLPLMSYGGSSIMFSFLSLGIVMNIRMRRFVN